MKFEPRGEPHGVNVEPWAVEFRVGPADARSIIAAHPADACTLSVSPFEAGLVVNVREGGSTFTWVRNDVVEFVTPESLAIPDLPLRGALAGPGSKAGDNIRKLSVGR